MKEDGGVFYWGGFVVNVAANDIEGGGGEVKFGVERV